MFNNLTRITASANSVVDLATAKSHCRIFTSDDDAYVTTLLWAAQAFVEGPNGIGVPLLTQQWKATFPRLYYETGLVLPLNPVQSVDSIVYLDMNGNPQTLAPAIYDYDLSHQPVFVTRNFNQAFPATLPVQKAVTVTFTCGYGDASTDVPADIYQALLLLISHYYENRSAVVGIDSRDSPQDMPFAVQAILDKYRVIAFA